MQFNTIIISKFDNKMENQETEVWTATLQLRWLEHGLGKDIHPSYATVKIRRLQQMWQGSLGHQKWIDVPTVTE